ncbi:MAG: hypothetical protein A2Y14_04830 [Verrucomicrobia bacterium GWF2_51_19]|nr:MAG: hypothetical protein A2Y14_04830 [Verrucomicrobia bacterium GWF2_51_19]HCJ11544.1 hypothetical protein [Opitutae bacterium]
MKAKEFIDKVKHLPVSPQVLPSLLKVIRDVNSSPFEVVDLVKVDPALSVQVLALSNSSYYGYSTKCAHVDEAVTRIGLSELYKMVSLLLSKKIASIPIRSYCLEEGELWEHSLACAMSMEFFAQRLGVDPLPAYTIGLFHALGKIIIDQEASERYSEVFKKIDGQALALDVAEREVFGFDHAEVGGELLKKWQFDSSVYLPIFYQFHPMDAPEHSHAACMLHLSLWLAACIGKNFGRDSWAMQVDVRVLANLKVNEDDLQVCMLEVHNRLLDLKSRLLKGILD